MLRPGLRTHLLSQRQGGRHCVYVHGLAQAALTDTPQARQAETVSGHQQVLQIQAIQLRFIDCSEDNDANFRHGIAELEKCFHAAHHFGKRATLSMHPAALED